MSVMECYGADTAGATPDFPQSRHVLYHFVRSAAFVSHRADELDQKDGTGKSLRNAFSSTVGLGDVDTPAVFALALELDAQFAALDRSAATIIANAKKSRTADGLLPPPPAELTALQRQKTALMDTLYSTLKLRLSAGAQTAIAAYLQRQKARPSALPPAGGNSR
jgi:hypothetical protein